MKLAVALMAVVVLTILSPGEAIDVAKKVGDFICLYFSVIK